MYAQHGRIHVFVQIERREDEHMHVFKRGIVADGARGLDAVHTRHPNVHEHHVGMQPRRQFHRFMAIARLAYHVDAVVRHQYELETAADEILIVRHQHPHALFHLRLRSLHRQAGNHAEAAAGSIARRKRAAQQVHALGHAGNAVPLSVDSLGQRARCGRGRREPAPDAIVFHHQARPSVLDGQADERLARTSMTHDVRSSLAGDAEQRHVHVGRHVRTTVGGRVERGFDSGVSEVGTQIVQPLGAGRRRRFGRVIAAAQHADHAANVQVYDRRTHKWKDMTEWAFLGEQERKKAMLGPRPHRPETGLSFLLHP